MQNDSSGLFEIDALTFFSGFWQGDYLIGTIKFLLLDTTTMQLDTTHVEPNNAHTMFAIEVAMEVPVYWQPGGYAFTITRQPPAVPTLTQWGMSIFGLAVLSLLIIYLRRKSPSLFTQS